MKIKHILATLGLIFAAQTAVGADSAQRIVTIGGSLTEIVYALGQEDQLVGRDRTSTYPASAKDLPDVGYMRALSPEGVLSVQPNVIIAMEGAGPPPTIDVLQEAGVTYITVPEIYSAEGITKKIEIVGAALGKEDAARQLAEETAAQLGAAEQRAQAATSQPARVLFILSTTGGKITVGGKGSSAEAIISLSGGVNAAGDIQGYKQMTNEAITQAAPDVILMMDRSGGHDIKATEELFAHPGLATTPAAKTQNVIYMDGLRLLSFGPRTAEAVQILSDHFAKVHR